MKRYLIRWTVAVGAMIAAIAAINYLVDPYAVYRSVSMHGFNEVKPRAQQQGKLGKRAGIEQVRPRALVLGNSRAEIGFDPAYAGWPVAARPVFNAALPGTGLRSNIEMLRHAIEVGKPALVIAGVEFKDFLTDQTANATASAQLPGSPDIVEAVKRRAREMTTAALSLDALTDSLLTLKSQFDPGAATLRADGFNPMRDYEVMARREGYYAMFRQRDMENARSYARGPRHIYVGATQTSPDFDALKTLLRLARAHGVELKLIIYPYHAHLLDTFRAAGLWPVFEQWKLALVEAISQEAVEASATPYVLWDFSGHHPYSAERVPKAGDKQQVVRWYWEAGHFKKELGDLMLDRVLGSRIHTDSGAFGVAIDRGNIASHLADLREQARQYASANPEQQADLGALVTGSLNAR